MYSRREYLKAFQSRYLKAGKAEKTTLLNEYISNTGHNRKYIIHQLNQAKLTLIQRHKKRSRNSPYGVEQKAGAISFALARSQAS